MAPRQENVSTHAEEKGIRPDVILCAAWRSELGMFWLRWTCVEVPHLRYAVLRQPRVHLLPPLRPGLRRAPRSGASLQGDERELSHGLRDRDHILFKQRASRQTEARELGLAWPVGAGRRAVPPFCNVRGDLSTCESELRGWLAHRHDLKPGGKWG